MQLSKNGAKTLQILRNAIFEVAKIRRPGWGYIIHIYPKPDVSIFAPILGVFWIFARIFAPEQKWSKNFCPCSISIATDHAKTHRSFRILGGAGFSM